MISGAILKHESVQFQLQLRQLHHGDASKDPQERALKVIEIIHLLWYLL